jgi:hypothetical protein
MNTTIIKNGEAKADSPAMAGSEVPTPRTNKVRDLINCDALSDNFSTWYDHACQLERDLTKMTQRANALEGGCHMAIGYISGSTPDPEKSDTYRYLKSVTSAGLPNGGADAPRTTDMERK